MNILVTLNKNYLPYLISLIRSINDNNKNTLLDFYVFSNDITLKDIKKYDKYLDKTNKYFIINIPKEDFKNAPISKRYPYEMYYRIFASKYLPSSLDFKAPSGTKFADVSPNLVTTSSFLNALPETLFASIAQ